MKTKVTKKFLKKNYKIINIGNEKLKHLLAFESPVYYCTRTEGWACDAYIYGEYALVNGYSCLGTIVSYDIMKQFEDKAVEIFNKYLKSIYSYEATVSMLKDAIDKFIQKVQ